MHQDRRHLIIGTAGHVDHGKTALVGALTGMETDRLQEEKERGLSIELGFAYFDLPDDSRAGIVDVPGHEKFIRSMLSGAYGMDIVLFVVDAKEGVQEQTLEHLAILDLLGISNGILVMTKSDLATADELSEATEMTQEMLIDTSLEGIPTVSVSAITGVGIEALKETIVKQVALATETEENDGIPRLYVDRVFTVQGFGVVVTGTLIGGLIHRDQRMVILPQGHAVRVRGIQVHNETASVAQAGQRTALNLSGISAQDLQRGDVLCPIEFSQVTDNIDVSMLCQKRRGIYRRMNQLDAHRVQLLYELPLSEMLIDFYPKLKSLTRGYGSLEYDIGAYKTEKLVKLDVLLNGNPVDALSTILPQDNAETRGKALVTKLKELIPRQMFEVPVQAAIGNKIVARETVRALRKNVTAKCYGGDVTRKRKLLERQKEGKKRLKQIGNVDVPQEAFTAMLATDE
ncbi:selenocysteine-specific translation elongation factor [Candidatus Poribacteria bacterium]|nr:selenocysteine-specific translation elongation factor [Candidatus Poribacteria bacterium]